MKKIIIHTDNPERYHLLSSLIQRIFPECELLIVPKKTLLSEKKQPQDSSKPSREEGGDGPHPNAS